MKAPKALLVALSILCMGGLGSGTDSLGGKYKYSKWDAWSKFGDGSWVKMEMVSKFRGRESKTTMTTTRIGNGEDRITLEVGMEMNGMRMPGRRSEVQRPTAAEKSKRSPCRKCSKVHRYDVRQSTARIKIAGKKLKCVLHKFITYDCKGKKLQQGKVWYSSGVPGNLVKMESRMAAGTTTLTCVGFEKK